MRRTIDADRLPVDELPRQVLLEFGALAPGESVEVRGRHELRGVLTALRAEREGTFDWVVLQSGPEVFRVEVRRRSHSGGLGIRDVLNADHERLDRAVAEVARLFEGPDRDEAALRLDELLCGLERHMVQEEQIVFAAIEQVSLDARAHVEVLRGEHELIRGLMRGLREAFAEQQSSALHVTSASLHLALKRHARRELWILYPLLDEIAGDRRAALLRALDDI